MSGYADAAYARSLHVWGEPLLLPRSVGWVLVRRIPGTQELDAMGAYPFFTCRDWQYLATDMSELSPNLVSLSLVTDPFGDFEEGDLRRAFPDLCIPYKQHFIVDLAANAFPGSSNHRRNLRRALMALEVEVANDPLAMLDIWCGLYARLVQRHDVKEQLRFSRSIFADQLAVPGMTAFVARRSGEPVGMTLWYEQGEVAYYHLGAYSHDGYSHGASFAIFAAAIEHFRPRLRWLALGAGAGASSAESGLTRFKRGWATSTRQTYLCGSILDPIRYQYLTSDAGTGYFPAYRAGEFA